MKILMAASEIVPFVKSGGLADVVGALPYELSKLGNDVKLFIPGYSKISQEEFNFYPVIEKLAVTVNDKNYYARIKKVKLPKNKVEIYFIESSDFFDRDELYVDSATGEDYKDNDLRFIFFVKAIIELVKQLEWSPDIIHAHDWQAGLLPVYLKTIIKDDPFFKNTKSVLTIHNLAYQGTFAGERYKNFGLPENLFTPTASMEFYKKVNILKGAIAFADKITTVSENYANEIQLSAEIGCGLEGVLSDRSNDLSGILNGVDYSIWSPSRDKKIAHNYYRSNLSGKRICKVELINQIQLPFRENAPLIGMISRIVDQKGFDLIAKIADQILAMDVQMILLGTGEDKYHQFFKNLENKYPDKFKALLTFDDDLAHKIEAGADIFLMPSKFEPCGLNQMYSLKYGTIPIVHKVGGLADTVENFDENSMNGNGFVFEKYESGELLRTIENAVRLFGKKRLWIKIMKAGMNLDFSWSKSARKYHDLFSSLK